MTTEGYIAVTIAVLAAVVGGVALRRARHASRPDEGQSPTTAPGETGTLDPLAVPGARRRPLSPAAARAPLGRLVEPWAEILPDTLAMFEDELQRELAPDHVLYNERVRFVGRRYDRDDFLLSLDGDRWAVVHLTFRGGQEVNAHWPLCELYKSRQAIIERLRYDSAEFLA